MIGTYRMLDLVPKGRDERDVEHKMGWVRHHDRYESVRAAQAGGPVDELFETFKKRLRAAMGRVREPARDPFPVTGETT